MEHIDLRKPSETEYLFWIERSSQVQAKDRAYVNNTNEADELEALKQIIPQILPQGKDTKEHYFRVLDFDEHENIGFIWFGKFPGIAEDMIILMDIMLLEEYRSKGLGRVLLENMQDIIKSKRYKKVYLEVRTMNFARNLYLSLGYKIIEEQEKNWKMVLEL